MFYQKAYGIKKLIVLPKFYYLDGEKILGENWSDNTKIRYFYNATGVIGFSYNGENYHYIKDLQQNIRAIVKDCDIICTYDYDSFGMCCVNYFNIKNR